MKTRSENGKLIIALEGRIDSGNAPEVEKELMTLAEDHADDTLVIDAAGLEYISSAGLRILMKLRKSKKAPLTVDNVSPEVYEIFHTTGFNELLDVRKRLREVSIEGCPEIGSGATGTVYKLNDEQILKLFNNDQKEDAIKREQQLTRAAILNGIETMIAFEMVRCNDRLGVIYELLNGASFSQKLSEDPQNFQKYAATYAALLKETHSIPFPRGDFPDAKEEWKRIIDYLARIIPPEEQTEMKAFIDKVPDRDCFIHGDYNPGNVLMMEDGSLTMIDLGNSSVGHPVFDLQGVYLGTVTSRYIAGEEAAKGASALWEVCKAVYFAESSEEQIAEYEKEIAVFASMRFLIAAMYIPQLRPAIQEEKEKALSAIRSGIELTF